ncbi:MAG: hypothetical protein ACI8RA_002988, partial [Chlamydiales bacterium]
MGTIKNSLTIELLGKKFDSHFELVNYAIQLAKNIIVSGRECRVPTKVQNPAYWVLLEIASGKDKLEDIITETEEEEGSKDALVKRVMDNKKNPI